MLIYLSNAADLLTVSQICHEKFTTNSRKETVGTPMIKTQQIYLQQQELLSTHLVQLNRLNPL